ncbi:MAG: TRAP transporter substrate-binding protein [Firmicutes bacterium]|nr:TRAP transporter substrate-binding protein [Bacillota bacterium]
MKKGKIIGCFLFVLCTVVLMSSVVGAEEINITFAAYNPAGQEEEQGMELFKELVEERSNGRIAVETFYGGVLGGERDQNDLVSVGEIQLAVTGNRLGSGVCPELMAMDVPYVISSEENLFKVWNGEIGDRIKARLEEDKGVSIMGVQRRGFRNLTTTDYKALTPDDIAGMKLRLPEIEEWVSAWKELDTIPVPIDSTEVFSALQMGTVEAQENPVSSCYAKSIWEVCDYMILTEHLANYMLYVANTDWLNSLAPEDREIVEQAMEEALAYANKWSRQNETKLLVKMQQKGLDVIVPDKELYQKAVAPAIEELAKQWAPGVYEEIVRIEGRELY